MLRLLVFLTVFLSLYSAMHALVYRGIRPLLPEGFRLRLPGLLFLALTVTAPVSARLLERLGQEAPARSMAFFGYLWMGFLFLAFSGFVLLLLIGLARRLFWLFSRQSNPPSWRSRAGAVTVLTCALLTGAYGFYEAGQLRVESVRIETDKLPAGVERIRVAQISDLHLGLILRRGTAEKLAAAIRELEPDLLVSTGDMVDARIHHLPELIAPFAALSPPLGKFAVTGNHEYYAGISQAGEFLRRCGFTLLRGESAAVGPGLLLAGIDDPAGGEDPDELALLKKGAPDRYTILLKHRPWVDKEALAHFDLQLSGHAHRGQIFPFNLVTGLEYPMQDGLYALAGGARLYTSRGTGTWGPPIRVLSPPELTLIEIVRSTPSEPD
ncbi:metallophosphoesterase [uncultured Desulfuromonas sp.]|uniref:metallophosphoesterase n=1 Tax=uncultured Desulfuromonas sp. TaxID=181013 RepID=UPI002624D028|nr:metallophosphoesterase [uncultured Desulfuromonas sp.]